MYEEHFGLARRPFGETTSAAAYVTLPTREASLRRLRYGLEHGFGPAALFGPPGVGKTLIARRLEADLDAQAVHLTFPIMPAGELVELVADELAGPAPAAAGMGPALRRIRDHLAARTAAGRRSLLVVDDAHLIDDPATFEALRLLLNFASNGPPDLLLLLVGTAELTRKLPPPLSDRLTARCLLSPLTETESAAYVAGRLAAAGATVSRFTPEALSTLYRAADGLPRRLNHLADLALLIAYAEGEDEAGTRAVAIAAREFGLDELAA